MSRRFRANTNDDDDKKEDGNNDDDDYEVINKGKKKKSVYKTGFQRAKKVVISPFYNLFNKPNTKKRSSSYSPSTSIPNSSSYSPKFHNYICCFCLSKPQTLDSASSDELDPDKNYECLKSLIEKNDFFSKECNTHLSD